MMPRLAIILAACAVLLLAGFWSGYTMRGVSADRDLAECQRTHAEALAVTLRAAQAAEADYRAREAQTAKLQQEALDAAHAETQSARADADRERAARKRLLNAAATAASHRDAAASAPALGDSDAASATADLPADLRGWLGAAVSELADAAAEIGGYATAARIAGLKCERDYKSLMAPRLGGH